MSRVDKYKSFIREQARRAKRSAAKVERLENRPDVLFTGSNRRARRATEAKRRKDG